MNTSPKASDGVLCPGCGAPNTEDAHFCVRCAAPLSPHATTDPVGSVLAEGYAARRAVKNPHKPIVIIGLWLWLLPITIMSVVGLVVGAGYVVRGLLEPDVETLFSGVIAGGASLFFLCLTGPMLLTATRNFLNRPKP